MFRNFNFHHPIESAMCYNRAVICINRALNVPDGSYLFYAALELRICIERFLFEYLVIMNTEDVKIEKYMKEYRIKNLSKAILEVEPEFDMKLEYTNFYLATIGADFQMQIPDKEKLNLYYGKLCNYLHSFKRPIDTTQNQEWWNIFIQLLEEVREFLFQLFKVPRAFFKMNENGLALYQAYKDNSISKEEIKKRILEGK